MPGVLCWAECVSGVAVLSVGSRSATKAESVAPLKLAAYISKKVLLASSRDFLLPSLIPAGYSASSSCAMSATALSLSSHSTKRVMRRMETKKWVKAVAIMGTQKKGISMMPSSAMAGNTMDAFSSLPDSA
ncbi:hypothetical protein ABL78_8287 [Leptomonas seymouri]|uniref:Uncharacterized protein n=1 Tax=Leptomonas seymouri TaxID=5684 RepID=A0A0N1HZD6_LEPSE|nr:hypothetical protein ABL78_8287 [Leptomonas seymouri]|eukprot:KPI82702.1 hypothetical protein ABL78_8287 [Leptomonas seymouri]